MSVNSEIEETILVDAAVARLRDSLPPTWSVERSQRQMPTADPGAPTATVDDLIELRGPTSSVTVAVEARGSLAPRDVERLLPRLTRALRTLAGAPVLVVAPWLSARTQELLTAEGINFIDLTGNAYLRLDYPGLFVRTDGAQRNPERAAPLRAQVRGPRAGRLLRLLADVTPPYGVRDLATAAHLSAGYVSRLLAALDREALVERADRGVVRSVDVPRLIHRWAESYDVLRTNSARTFLAPQGAAWVLERLGTQSGRIAVTGSFAAVRLAPVAGPALLLVYASAIDDLAASLGLLPTDEGANVALLSPFDGVVWLRSERVGEITYVAPSQVAVDCLTGTGRMPAEGEAVLGWMVANEPQWRLGFLGQPAIAET